MSMRQVVAASLVVFGLGWTAGQVFSQDGGMGGAPPAGGKQEPKPAPQGPTAEEMAAWEKAMTPGEQHKKMAAREGTWDTTGKFWMAPDAPPTESKGVAKFKMVLGGRYEMQEYNGEMMGAPFQGIGIAGYDNVKKKHFSTWIDSMGTGMMVLEGTADEKGVVTIAGTMVDPATGKDCKVRMVTAEKDKDSIQFEMFVDDGKGKGEAKCMELNYTRRK